MTKKEILDYVMENPGNTNVSVLGPMVDAVAGITPTGKIEITENGTGIDVSQYAEADVNVSGGVTYPTITISASGHPKFAGTNKDFYIQYISGESSDITSFIQYKSNEATYEDKAINCFSQSWLAGRVEGFITIVVDAASTTSTLSVSGTNINVLTTSSYFTNRKINSDVGHNQCSYISWFVATGANPTINVSWS